MSKPTRSAKSTKAMRTAKTAKAGKSAVASKSAKSSEAPEPTEPPDTAPSIRRVMMPRDTNALGTIFGGVILAEVDLAAATEAHKCHPGRLVTVSFDRVDFKQPVYVGDLVSFHTVTEHVGRTSIRVRVSVWAQRRFGHGGHAHVTEASVTMVAVDDKFKPVPIELC
jgi:acyl-CoA thioesterase YciA